MLKYPKLCHDSFALLSHLLEVYPEMLLELNAESFSRICEALKFGLCNQDAKVVDMCLRALKALASYHFKETAAGKDGFSSHASGIKDLNGKTQEGILSQFTQLLLQFLLFEDYCTDLVSSAADA